MRKCALLGGLLAAASVGAAQEMSTAAVAASTPARVDVVWPKEGARYPYLNRSFTFGNVAPGSTLTINGQLIPVRPSGAFLSMVDFSTGAFKLSYAAEFGGASSAAVRNVLVEAPFGMAPGDAQSLRVLEPVSDLELRPGELLTVRVLGPSGLGGTFEIKGLTRWLPLAERAGGTGLYEGHYKLGPRDQGQNLKLKLHLKGSRKNLKADAPGRVTVLDPSRYRVAVTTASVTVMKSLPGGYTFFLPPGIPLAVTGRAGNLWRVELSDTEEGWVDADRIRWLPQGTPPPSASVGRYISVVPAPESVKVHFTVERPLPFEVRHWVNPLGFEVRFYGGLHRVDRIHYPPQDSLVREVLWRQESARLTAFTVNTNLAYGWGYDAYYENNRFVLEIRRPPLLPEGKGLLAGRRIAIDPGHGPELSAIGPLASSERDLVLALSERLRDLLQAEGASVYMVRVSSSGPPLAERTALAWDARADLYVSVHANALPVTADPEEAPRGFMTFYYQPHSRALAEAVHGSYRRAVGELADEGLRWGDLHVCRVTQMPAILTESAYVMLPEQEEMLRDPRQQERFARAILDGIRSFYEGYRKLQLASPIEKQSARVP